MVRQPTSYTLEHLPPQQLVDLFDRDETPLPEDAIVDRATVALILAELMDIARNWCPRDNTCNTSWISIGGVKNLPSVILDHTTNGMIIVGPHMKNGFLDELTVYDGLRYLLWDPSLSPIGALFALIQEINGKNKFAYARQDGVRLPLGRHGDAPTLVPQAVKEARARAKQLWTELQKKPPPIMQLFHNHTPLGPHNDN